MLEFLCGVCQKKLQAPVEQAGRMVRCPHCMSTLRVPQAKPAMASTGPGEVDESFAPLPDTAPAPTPPRTQPPRPTNIPQGGRRYGFNCQYCSSRLEAVESMAGTEGQCPTCGNNIVIPILDRYGRLIDPMTGKVIKQDPHPVHAYAAAGMRAPKIIRRTDGGQAIQCPRCPSVSPIDSNNCKACGMPFTMEGTTADAVGSSNGFAVASLVLGILSLLLFCTIIVPVLAVIFGGIALVQINQGGSNATGKGQAIAGIVCGIIGLIIAGMSFLF